MLVGAATVLVVLVAVFLAYNANKGLPFVPTYELNAELPSAANLVRGNDVRIGGDRVGVVDTIKPRARRRRQDSAMLGAQARQDGRAAARQLHGHDPPALGARAEVRRAHSRALGARLQDGDTIPLASATPRPVEFDEFFNTFDDETRAGDRSEPAADSATRSPAAARASTRRSVRSARCCSTSSRSRATSPPRRHLPRFFRALDARRGDVAPVAE